MKALCNGPEEADELRSQYKEMAREEAMGRWERHMGHTFFDRHLSHAMLMRERWNSSEELYQTQESPSREQLAHTSLRSSHRTCIGHGQRQTRRGSRRGPL